MVEALKIILEGKSYRVEVAFDGKQGINAIKEEKPDLIILDLLLPGEDGATICHNLKSNPQHKDIPILVLTALAREMKGRIFPTVTKKYLEADEYLDKPINPQELVEKVGELLQEKQGKADE